MISELLLWSLSFPPVHPFVRYDGKSAVVKDDLEPRKKSFHLLSLPPALGVIGWVGEWAGKGAKAILTGTTRHAGALNAVRFRLFLFYSFAFVSISSAYSLNLHSIFLASVLIAAPDKRKLPMTELFQSEELVKIMRLSHGKCNRKKGRSG